MYFMKIGDFAICNASAICPLKLPSKPSLFMSAICPISRLAVSSNDFREPNITRNAEPARTRMSTNAEKSFVFIV